MVKEMNLLGKQICCSDVRVMNRICIDDHYLPHRVDINFCYLWETIHGSAPIKNLHSVCFQLLFTDYVSTIQWPSHIHQAPKIIQEELEEFGNVKIFE